MDKDPEISPSYGRRGATSRRVTSDSHLAVIDCPHAGYKAKKLSNPRCVFLGREASVMSWDKQTRSSLAFGVEKESQSIIFKKERQFLPPLKEWVSLPLKV